MSQYSTACFGALVHAMVPEPLDHRDYVWLCNRLVKLAHYHKDECVDSFRVCISVDGNTTAQYKHAITCCGSDDMEVINPLTANTFWIGCNYGH